MRLEKALITNTVTGEQIPVMFNPEQYVVTRDLNLAAATVPGLSAPLLQFVSGGAATLEMELLLDTYEAHLQGTRTLNAAGQDVRAFTRRIASLMDIDPATHAPPVVVFTWASLAFTCLLTRVVQTFVMFLADGTPVRARVMVTFTEFRNSELEAKEVKRETADYSKLHTVSQGQTLPDIAAAAYGDPAGWRPIAIANAIDDPRALPEGLRLLVPDLPFRNPETGEVITR